jgi:AcrR family transcriptional regulator
MVDHGNGETWQRIVEQARALFAEKGYNGTGVAEIARAAGVTNAGLYHYVSSKEELLYVVLNEALARHLQTLEEIAARGGSAQAKLDGAIDNHLDFVFNQPTAVKVFLAERRFLSGEFEQKYSAQVRRYNALFDRLLQEASTKAGARRDNPKLQRFMVLGMINWIPEWYEASGRIKESELRTYIKSVIFERLLGLGAPDGDGHRAKRARPAKQGT